MYKIEELNSEEKIKYEQNFKVVEQGYESLTLEFCQTKEEAERAIEEWEARDELRTEIEDFADKAVEKYKDRIPREEVLAMITDQEERME